jgi:hypothetical protein
VSPCPACTNGSCLICRADWHELATRLSLEDKDARERMRRSALRRVGLVAATLLLAGCDLEVGATVFTTMLGFLLSAAGGALAVVYACDGHVLRALQALLVCTVGIALVYAMGAS